MNSTSDPQNHILPELATTWRTFAAEAEKLGQIHPLQLESVYRNRLFNLFVPKTYGGLEVDLLEGLRKEEAMAWGDGSMGWTITLCAGANWFVGFFPPDAAREIFFDPAVCLAGSGKSSGVAKITDDGYQITGNWKYATGAPHATIFTANCNLEKDGILLRSDSGDLLIRSFWFKRDEVAINEDWDTIGMIATASHSFSVDRLNVPNNRSFQIDRADCFLDHPVYKYPFVQFAETTLAVNSSGMAVRFLDLCKEIFEQKRINEKSEPKRRIVQEILMAAKARIDGARSVFYSVVEKSWEDLLSHEYVSIDLLEKVSEVSRGLAKTARQTVDELYPYCGMMAVKPQTEINRVWRNLHTASQHSLLLFSNMTA